MDALNLCRQAAELQQSGNSKEAERLYLQVLAAEPGNFTALYLLGQLRAQQGRKTEALDLIRAALKANPDSPSTHFNLGVVLQELAKPQEALAGYDRALTLKPDFAAAFFGRGNVLRDLKRYAEALADYDRSLALRPGVAMVLSNRGGVLRSLGRFEEALASYDRALAAAPDDAAVWNNRGHLLRSLGSFAAAVASYDKALVIHPDDAQAWDDRGAALHALRRFDDAIASFERAIAADGDYAPAWFHKSFGLLLMEEFREGLPLLEWRHKLAGARKLGNFSRPVWSGRDDIAGKTLFVHWEEGLGDTIHFFGFARLAAARGAKVIFSAPAPLTELLAMNDAAITVIGPEEVPAHFDFHIAQLSLPLALGIEFHNIPAAIAYLKAPGERVRLWRDRLGGHGFRIGIVWATTTSRSLGRSYPLLELEGLSQLPGVRLIGLQKNDGLDELSSLPPAMRVEIPGAGDSFLDTAAIMENLDLVITADTAAAHLAGALGRPVWVALKYVADWRWFLDRAESVWYPAMRLFRQQADGDWAGVFAAMKAELACNLKEPRR